MAPIDVAMAQSLRRRSLMDVVTAAVYPVVSRRSVTSSISDVKTAFSSWDNCMNAAYCKWPVIAVIIIGALIIISVIWCIARCACCGVSCCCECCYCLKCCGNCCGCCSPPNKRHKYLDEPFMPPNHNQNQGYRSQAPMMSGAVPPAISEPPIAAGKPQFYDDKPQYASFDVAKKGNEDALPAMPSWESANQTKVLVIEEAVEMDELKKPAGQPPARAVSPLQGTSPTPAPVSPVESTFGHGNGGYMPPSSLNNVGGYPAAASGYMAPGAMGPAGRNVGQDPYGQGYNQQQYNNGGNGGNYGGNYGSGPGFGAPGQGVGMGQNWRSPAQAGGPSSYNNQQVPYGNQQAPYGSQQPSYGSQQPAYDTRSPPPPQQQGFSNMNSMNRMDSTNSMNRANGANGMNNMAGGGYASDYARNITSSPAPRGFNNGQQGYGNGAQNYDNGAQDYSNTGSYDNYNRNASISPAPQTFTNNSLDHRAPRIPDLSMDTAQAASTPVNEPAELYSGSPVTMPAMPSELYGAESPSSRPLANNRPVPQRTYSPATMNNGYSNDSGSNNAVAEMPGSMAGFDFGTTSSQPAPDPSRENYGSSSGGYNGGGSATRSNTDTRNDSTGGQPYGLTNTGSPPPLMQPKPQGYQGYRPYQNGG